MAFLSSPLTKFFLVPLLTVLLSFIIKVTSVNDKYPIDSAELFFLGPDMLSAGILLVFIELCNAGVSAGVIWALVLCGISLLLMPLWIRKLGCKVGPITNFWGHHLWRGIIIPDLWGVALLYGILQFLSK